MWGRRVGWVAAALGAVFLAVAVGSGVWRWQFLARAAGAEATVVGIDAEPDSEGGSVYTPRLAFEAGGGRRVEFQSGLATNPCPYQVGDRVAVVYDPEAPARAEINTPLRLWFLPGFAALLGVVLGGVGGVLVTRSGRRPLAPRVAAGPTDAEPIAAPDPPRDIGSGSS